MTLKSLKNKASHDWDFYEVHFQVGIIYVTTTSQKFGTLIFFFMFWKKYVYVIQLQAHLVPLMEKQKLHPETHTPFYSYRQAYLSVVQSYSI